MPSPAFTSAAVTWAIFSAAVSIIAKVAYDALTEERKRRGAAAALAGEIAAYTRLVRPIELVASIRNVANADRASRVEWLRSYPKLPVGHPVFDKVADQIGGLSPEIARRVSEVYNVVTGMRTLAAGFSTPAFTGASDGLQAARLNKMASLLEEEMAHFPEVVALLEARARPLHRRICRRLFYRLRPSAGSTSISG